MRKQLVFEFDKHLDDIGYHKYCSVKGKFTTKKQDHQEVYDTGLKVLEKEYRVKNGNSDA